jgi:hypothetical protein
MADVVLDARMSNEELLGSIDKVLGNMEKKFDASVNNINAKLATIGSNLGQGFMSGFNSQLNSAEKKLDELQNKANRSSSSSSSTKSININDNNREIYKCRRYNNCLKEWNSCSDIRKKRRDFNASEI